MNTHSVLSVLLLHAAAMALSLMNAINRREKDNAVQFLNALLASDTKAGSLSMEFNTATPVEKEHSFV